MKQRWVRSETPYSHREAVSQKRRRCEDCRGVIEPGDRYARLSAPPNGELGNERWWTLYVHAECPA